MTGRQARPSQARVNVPRDAAMTAVAQARATGNVPWQRDGPVHSQLTNREDLLPCSPTPHPAPSTDRWVKGKVSHQPHGDHWERRQEGPKGYRQGPVVTASWGGGGEEDPAGGPADLSTAGGGPARPWLPASPDRVANGIAH